MTAQPVELPSNAPTPTNIPTGDKLLKDFKATLEVRWSEFDKATLEEARGSSYFRNKDSDFIKAKATFDTAKAMLEPIQNDAQLKSDTKVLPTVEAALKSITDYLKEVKPEEKGKKINIILANTTADLSKFKADITGKLEDQKSAEDAKVSVATAIAAGGGVLATEAAEGLSKAVGEGAKDLGKEAAAIKKNPIKKIAEFFGFSETSIVGDFKSALAEKKEGGFGGFFGGIKVWFYGFLAKMFGTDLSKYLTPEELKLAGIKGKVGGEVTPQAGKENGNDEEKKKKEAKYSATTLILGEIASNENKEITKMYGLDSVKTLKYSELITFSEKDNVSGLRSRLGVGTDVSDAAIAEFMKLMTSKDHPLYFLLAGSYEKKGNKKLVDATTFDILSHVGSDIKILGSIKSIDITNHAESTKKMANNMLTIDPNGEVSGELVTKAEELGISKNLLRVLFAPRITSFVDKKSITTILQDPSLGEKDKEMLQKIGVFGEGFIGTLKTDKRINFGIGEQVSTMHAEGKINLGDILKSYIMTKGETNIDSMDTLQKVGAYTSFLMIAGSTSDGSGALSGKIFNLGNAVEFAKGNSIFDAIPQDVQKLLKDMFDIDVILKKIKDMGIAMSDYMTSFAKESPAFATLLILTVLFLPVFAQRTTLSRILTGK